MDLTSQFKKNEVNLEGHVTTMHEYLNPDEGHGISYHVINGTLNFTVRAERDRNTLGTGRDMFLNMIDHAEKNDIVFSKIGATWMTAKSVYADNLTTFNKNVGENMTPKSAAALTWTGRMAALAGYTNVHEVKQQEDAICVVFEKPFDSD